MKRKSDGVVSIKGREENSVSVHYERTSCLGEKKVPMGTTGWERHF